MAYVWYRKPGLESALLTLAHAYSTVAVAWGILHGDLGGVGVRITNLVPLFFVMGWIVTRRFARSLTDAERLNAELERRVETKRAEIASNAEQVQALTRQQALADERRRIMSDMHDGIGGQLISTLSLVEHGDASKEDLSAACPFTNVGPGGRRTTYHTASVFAWRRCSSSFRLSSPRAIAQRWLALKIGRITNVP